MNRSLAVIAAVLCLGVGAVGCSSSTTKAASPAPTSAAASTPATGEPVSGQGCDASTVKMATKAMTPEKDAMNKSLTATDPALKITNLTSDDSCYLVLQTNAKPTDAKAKQSLKPVEQGFSETLTSGSAIKGVKITAVDGSTIYQTAAK